MVVGFLSEAAWQSTPKRSKTIAAQRLSSTRRGSQCRLAVSIAFGRYWPGVAALIVRHDTAPFDSNACLAPGGLQSGQRAIGDFG
jgi:hypothetical protein